jgi:hypothetical protein
MIPLIELTLSGFPCSTKTLYFIFSQMLKILHAISQNLESLCENLNERTQSMPKDWEKVSVLFICTSKRK